MSTRRVGRRAAAALILSASLGRGDATDEYRQKFRDGMAHYKEGRFAQAVDHWEAIAEAMGDEQAYRLLYNLGVACDELGRATRAAAYLTRFSREVAKRPPADVPDEVRAFASDAAARVARLQASHGRLSIASPSGEPLRLRIDGEERTRDVGLTFYLTPGRHEITLRAGSQREEQRQIVVEAGKATEITLAPLPAPPPVIVSVPTIVTVTVPPQPPPPARPFSPWWIGVAAGASVASVALPLALRSQATATKRSYDDPDANPRARAELADDYERERARYNLSWALPVALSLGTGALVAVYVMGGPKHGRVRPSTNGVALSF